MNRQLAEVFNFTEADLEANHKGRLSEEQLSEYRHSTRETLLIFRLVLLLLLIPILVVFNRMYSPITALIVVGMAVAAIFAYQHLRKQADATLKAGDLKVTEGFVKFRWMRKRRYLFVGNEYFRLNSLQFDAIWENHRYRFYYTGNRVWSCEFLS